MDGRFVPPANGEHFTTLNPASEEPLAQRRQAARRTSTRRSRRRGRRSRPAGAAARRERAEYLYRIARAIQERAREFAVLESMDNGKPIKGSRDVDIPLAAAHFFYHAGWADKLGYAGFGPVPPLGVAGQVIPWNFPLLMAAWKLAPALATGNTCVLKQAETTPLTALLLAEVIAEAGLRPARSTSSPATAAPGPGSSATRGSTRSRSPARPRSASRSRRASRHRQGAHAGAGRQGGEHRVRRRAHRPGGRGRRQRHLLQPGARVLRGFAAAAAGVGRGRSAGPAERRLATLSLGDPLDKNTDLGAIDAPAARQDRGPRRGGRAEGGAVVAAVPAAGQGLLVPADGVLRREPVARVAREEIFGPVLSVLTFRTPEEAVAKANNTAYGLSAGVWTEKGTGSCGWRGLRAGSSGPTPTTGSTRPARSAGTRRAVSGGRAAGPGSPRTSMPDRTSPRP